MASQDRTTDTVKIDTAPATTYQAGTILVASGSNVGQAAVSGSKARKFLGVTTAISDKGGYVAIERGAGKVVDVIAGAVAVSYGDQIVSDGSGNGVPFVPLNSGAIAQIIGVALTAQTVQGSTFQMLIQPEAATG
jgi:hypothetical protein